MASNADLKTRISTLRHEILSYKPGKAVPCDGERVVFPDKLVIGMVDLFGRVPHTVSVLRHALHGDLEASKVADISQTSTENQEEYLTDSISIIMLHFTDLDKDVRDLAGKFGCMVPLVKPDDIVFSRQWIKVIQDVTGRVPLGALLSTDKREDNEKAKHDLNHHGITYICELAVPGQILSYRNQLQWLDLIHECLQEGDRVLAINELKETKLARREVERLQTEMEDERGRAEKGKRSLPAEMKKKLESWQQRVDTLMKIVQEKDRNETTLRQQVEELKKGREDDRARGEKGKRSLTAEMTKKLESKQRRVDTLTEIVGERERNETTLRQQVEELKKRGEKDRARGEQEKRSLAAEMTKEIESKKHCVDTLMKIAQENERNETSLIQQIAEVKKGREEDRARGEQEKRLLAGVMTKEIESKKHRVDSLTEILREKERNETTLRQQVEELKNERQEDRAQFEKERRSIESSWKKELGSQEKRMEQLERVTWKLRTKIQLENETRSAEQKKKAETSQWMQSLIPWMNSGKQAQGGTSSSEDNSTGGMGSSDTLQAGEELPDDEFADILKTIAVELYDEDKIDSLGGQLGFLQGDIQRAHMTNMRFNRVTSDGTRHMLNQWRRGVSREDERIELRKALQAAKLVNLAEQFLREDTQIDARDETSQEQDQTKGHTDTKVLRGATASNDHTPRDEHTGDMASEIQEDLTDGSRSQHPDKSLKRSTEKFDASAMTSEDVSSGEVNAGDDMTDVSSIQPAEPSSSHEMQVLPEDMSGIAPLVSSGEKPNDQSTILDKSHVGGIISDGEDLISQLVLIDTSPEKILLLSLLKIIMAVSQKALRL